MGYLTFFRKNIFSGFVLIAMLGIFLVTVANTVFDTFLDPVLDRFVGGEFNALGVDVAGVRFPLGKLVNVGIRLLALSAVVYFAAGRPQENVIKDFL